jgi:Flp pilus assembly protein TadG
VTAAPARRRPARRAAAGQVLVLFALTSLVLLGVLGLALDGGYDYIQRRAMQNAADAAALAGASAIARNQTDSQVTQAVLDAAARNSADTTRLTCAFITNAYDTTASGTTQPCSSGGVAMATFAANFTGVLVGTTERHQTFVFGALGIAESGASASAAARVQRPVGVTGGPFMVCGIDTAVTTAGTNGYRGGIYLTAGTYPTTTATNGTPTTIRTDGFDNCSGALCKKVRYNATSGAALVNPQAYAYSGASLTAVGGPAYLIHASNNLSVCNDNSSSFKGINTNAITYNSLFYRAYADPGYDTFPGYKWPPLTTGTVASITATVDGLNGCQAGGAVDNCIMILPVCDASGPGGTGSNAILAVRSLEAFYVRQTSSNSHTGQLIANYTIRANSDPTYVVGGGGVSVIKLIK